MIQATSAEIESTLHSIVSQVCGDGANAFGFDDDLRQVVELDSLATVQLTIEINRAFGINFGVEATDLDALQSIASLARVVRRRLSAKA